MTVTAEVSDEVSDEISTEISTEVTAESRPQVDAEVSSEPMSPFGVELGVYEKALRHTGSWDDLFAQARDAGFAFVDLSVDESPQRAARLHWQPEERRAVREAAARAGVALGGVCLSVHRRIAPGSADPQVRAQAVEVLRDGINLCADLAVPVLQLAGYFAHYERTEPQSRDRYVECLRWGAQHAARRGVLLGIENVDGDDINSISAAMSVIEEIDSAWLWLYPDIGNLAEHGLDVVAELAAGSGRMLALHVKDVRPGEPRRVPMGEGIVAWDAAFAELARQQWSGRVMIEMWNDDAPDSVDLAGAARHFIQDRLHAAGIAVWAAEPRAQV